MIKRYSPIRIILMMLLIVTLACNSSSNLNEPDSQPTATSNLELASTPTSAATQPVEPSPTPIVSSTSAVIAQVAASATPLPTQVASCTTLTNLKVRNGPGTAYEPPLTAVATGTTLIPFGFNPLGVPDGSWALVKSSDGAFTGWVSASKSFLTCTIDLATLPSVQVAPPPPTATPQPTSTPNTQGAAPRVSNNGGFGDCPFNLTCETSFSPASLYAEDIRSTSSNEPGDGVEFVKFTVWDSLETIEFYKRQEVNSLYCTFGGDGPCNGWIYENGSFRWYSGGDPVVPGDYVMTIEIQGTEPDDNDNSQGFMRFTFTISPP
jgi:hypothetical protein